MQNDIATENREAYEYCRDNGHLDFVTKAELCDKYTRSDQWDPKIIEMMKRRRKPYITMNKILSVFATLAGEHLARRSDVAFRAARNGSIETAAALDKLWLNFSQTQRLNSKEGRVFWDGVIRGRGFFDLRISFNEAMMGEPVVSYLNSKDVLLFPDDSGNDPDDWSGVLVTKWLAPATIAELYGVPLDEVKGNAGADYIMDHADWTRDQFGLPRQYIPTGLSDAMQDRYRRLRVIERQEFKYVTVPHFVDRETGETRRIPANWDHNRISETIAQYGYGVIKRRTREIQWVASMNTLTLHNSTSPYQHLTVIPYFPFLIGGQPVGIVEHLLSPQDLLNKSVSQELHIVAGIANSGWKVKKGALSNMTLEQLRQRGGEDGLVVEYNTNPADVEKISPNQVPSGIDRLSQKAGASMAEISLVSDSMQGLDRADVSGDAIEMKARRGSASLSPIYASLADARSILARNWLDLTQQFVTEERVVAVTGPGKRAQTEQVTVNQEQPDGSWLNDLTVGEYAVSINDVKERDSFDLEQFGYLTDMIRNGAPIPWSSAVDSLTILENRDKLVELLKQREGLNPPGEAEKKRQELETAKLEADVEDKKASANVKNAQAQKTQAAAASEGQPDPAAEHKAAMDAQAADHKAALDERKAQLDAAAGAAKIEAMYAQMQVDQQRAAMELQRMREEIALDRQARLEEMQLQREQMQLTREMLADQRAHALEMNNIALNAAEDKRKQAQDAAEDKRAQQAAAAAAKASEKPYPED